MKVLLTGAHGFLGTHVISSLVSHPAGTQIIGISRQQHSRGSELALSFSVDLREEPAIRALLEKYEFDTCVHLAGVMPPRPVDDMFQTNILGTANLLRYVRTRRVILISSAAVYGQADNSGLVTEEAPVAPVNPYGHGCVARECVARMFCTERRIELLLLRLFNLVGPGQSDHMMVPAFARQIALIESGQQEPILRVGCLDTRRDYVDVRDVATAISNAVLKHPLPPIVNIGSGILHSGRQVLEKLLLLTDRSLQVISCFDPERRGDVPCLGNGSNLARSSLDWAPTRQLESSLADILANWRKRMMACGS